MSKRIASAVALLVAVSMAPAASPASAAPAKGEHCVVHVTGQRPTGELTVSAPRCYSTFAGAMQAEGVAAWGDGAAERVAAQGGAGLLLFTLGTHYDYANFNGAGGSTSTVGASCSGYVNLSPTWNNRISSTANGCSTITHFDLANLGGINQATNGGGGNLTTLNNKATSIQYA